MKFIKKIIMSALFLAMIAGSMQTFQSCEWIIPDEKENDTIKIDPYPCDTCIVAYKPNIYLYPEIETELEVSLDFPLGGSVIASIPDYENGWSVNVEPDGTIDGEYTYLFYESSQPNVWQTDSGWCIPVDQMETFLRANLYAYGFRDNEIDDFIEYWIPRLRSDNFYLLYPQSSEIIDEVIQLNISQEPDNVQRFFYFIKPSDEAIQMQDPHLSSDFEREGFYLLEWGVLLDY